MKNSGYNSWMLKGCFSTHKDSAITTSVEAHCTYTDLWVRPFSSWNSRKNALEATCHTFGHLCTAVLISAILSPVHAVHSPESSFTEINDKCGDVYNVYTQLCFSNHILSIISCNQSNLLESMQCQTYVIPFTSTSSPQLDILTSEYGLWLVSTFWFSISTTNCSPWITRPNTTCTLQRSQKRTQQFHTQSRRQWLCWKLVPNSYYAHVNHMHMVCSNWNQVHCTT